ncbi:MAG: cupin domain-containing protein [Oleiphilaceae bacterium]|nr:cupin domain-containing protein [Oleiphilaceae bacterium]
MRPNEPLDVLGGISAEHFLREYWQKKPLLIRQALPEFESPITPDEMAGLSLEEDIESRIIIEQEGTQHWKLETGPFSEERFSELEGLNWTLLIQQLDAWLPEANALKKLFNFIPDWRVDDIMASYAPKGGSVGPHCDFYDVFLVQAYGERHWRLGQWCDATTPTRSDTNLSILEEFETSDDWVLKPGDILYVPPKLAHYGIAENDCITLSVGFRAPKALEALSSFTDYLCEKAKVNPFFSDPNRAHQYESALISDNDKAALQQLLLDSISDKEMFNEWLGSFLSEPKNNQILIPDDDISDAQDALDALSQLDVVYKNEGSRFFYTTLDKDVYLSVDGESFKLNNAHLTFVQHLCVEDEFDAQSLLTYCNMLETQEVIAILLNKGSLQLESD